MQYSSVEMLEDATVTRNPDSGSLINGMSIMGIDVNWQWITFDRVVPTVFVFDVPSKIRVKSKKQCSLMLNTRDNREKGQPWQLRYET